jgi:hypothetical protein
MLIETLSIQAKIMNDKDNDLSSICQKDLETQALQSLPL